MFKDIFLKFKILSCWKENAKANGIVITAGK
jgi:hypothetical protein